MKSYDARATEVVFCYFFVAVMSVDVPLGSLHA